MWEEVAVIGEECADTSSHQQSPTGYSHLLDRLSSYEELPKPLDTTDEEPFEFTGSQTGMQGERYVLGGSIVVALVHQL